MLKNDLAVKSNWFSLIYLTKACFSCYRCTSSLSLNFRHPPKRHHQTVQVHKVNKIQMNPKLGSDMLVTPKQVILCTILKNSADAENTCAC